MSGNRTDYDKNFNKFYDDLAKNSKGFFDKKPTKENYLSYGDLVKKQEMKLEDHRSDFDKNYNKFYDSKSFNAKAFPYNQKMVDASENEI